MKVSLKAVSIPYVELRLIEQINQFFGFIAQKLELLTEKSIYFGYISNPCYHCKARIQAIDNQFVRLRIQFSFLCAVQQPLLTRGYR